MTTTGPGLGGGGGMAICLTGGFAIGTGVSLMMASSVVDRNTKVPVFSSTARFDGVLLIERVSRLRIPERVHWYSIMLTACRASENV